MDGSSVDFIHDHIQPDAMDSLIQPDVTDSQVLPDTTDASTHPITDPCGPSDWEWQRPLPDNNNITAVWGAGPTDIYMVGHCGLILHYNGQNWSPMNSGVSTQLDAMWGTSSTDLFAVGDYGSIVHLGP